MHILWNAAFAYSETMTNENFPGSINLLTLSWFLVSSWNCPHLLFCRTTWLAPGKQINIAYNMFNTPFILHSGKGPKPKGCWLLQQKEHFFLYIVIYKGLQGSTTTCACSRKNVHANPLVNPNLERAVASLLQCIQLFVVLFFLLLLNVLCFISLWSS